MGMDRPIWNKIVRCRQVFNEEYKIVETISKTKIEVDCYTVECWIAGRFPMKDIKRNYRTIFKRMIEIKLYSGNKIEKFMKRVVD